MFLTELTVHNLGTAVIGKPQKIFQPRAHKLLVISFIIMSCSFGQCSSCWGLLADISTWLYAYGLIIMGVAILSVSAVDEGLKSGQMSFF